MPSPDEPFLARCRYYCRTRSIPGHLIPASDFEKNWRTLLRQQAARNPGRFLPLFHEIIASEKIPNAHALPLFEGLIQHLLHRIHSSSESTLSNPPCTLPAEKLGHLILDALAKYPFLTETEHRVADALIASGDFPATAEDASGYMAHLLPITVHADPEPTGIPPKDLYTVSCDSVRGKAATAAVRFATALRKGRTEWPDLLPHLLFRLATDPHPGVRIPILTHLPLLSRHDADMAWRLFTGAVRNHLEWVWHPGEDFLMDRYVSHPEQVRNWLSRNRKRIPRLDGDKWSAKVCSALLKGRISEKEFLSDLHLLDSKTARDEAFDCLLRHLATAPGKGAALRGLLIWMDQIPFSSKRLESIRVFFEAMGTESIDITTQIAYKFIFSFDGANADFDLDWLYRWMAAVFAAAPSAAIRVCEGLASRIAHSDRLFRQWEGHRLVRVCQKNLIKVSDDPESERFERVLELERRNCKNPPNTASIRL